MNYKTFINNKSKLSKPKGFDPVFIPDYLFDFQKHVVQWGCETGKAAFFQDCGLGKTVELLVFAENVRRITKGNVLILTPLAVSFQTVKEGEKFGIKVIHNQTGDIKKKGIYVTNYERLKNFNKNDFVCVIDDESSILKNYSGKIRQQVTDFMQGIPYRLLTTATPAPNDYMEFGTSSEALGVLRRVEMLSTFFVHDAGDTQKWVLKGHGEKPFWRWMATWARAMRKPSDLGFENGKFDLPPMHIHGHFVPSLRKHKGLLPSAAVTLHEQREERRLTVQSRCEKVAELADNDRPFIAWGSLNDECDLLEKLIPDAVQVAGRHSDEEKEQRLLDFAQGNIGTLVSKPSIAGFGLNFQHCADMSYFPSHSHEQFYQSSRRCWRFGQENEVNCHIVASEGEMRVVQNMRRKEKLADRMFQGIINNMHDFQLGVRERMEFDKIVEVPKWLK